MKGHPPGAASGPATASIGSSCIPPAHPAAGASSGQAQHGKAGSLLPPSIWLRPTRKPSSPTSPSSPSQTFRSVPPRSPPSPAATATATAAALSPATLPQIVPTPLLSAPAPPIPPSAAPPGAPPLPAVPATPPVSTIQAGPPATQSPPHTLEIPFSRPKTLVFLDTTSQIEKGHVKRFETVVDILRQAVESDSRVRQHASNIDYYLRMCGPSRLEMYPSVLVCCPPWILKKLDKLFRKGLVARQYLRTVRDRRSILSSGGILSISGQSNASASSPYPSYDLYFWASDEPLRLTTGVDIVIAQSATGSIAIYGSDLSQTTLCGASLHWATGGARISTIGCLVQVDNKPFCLTAYHGMFGDPWQLSRSAKDLDLLNSTDSSSMYDEDSDSEDFDGISYDLPSEADSRSAPQKTSTARDPVQSDSEVSLHPGESTRSAIINSIVEPSPIRSYGSDHLDWALFPLSGTTQILPNLYWDSQNSPQPRILDSVSDKEPGLDIDVYITASQGRVKKGKLDSVPALLGALTYPHHHAIMWTVVMEQGDGESNAVHVRFRL
ncbi:uncharacterized protein B0I36DRAFT_96042 [Microdochium trichocladiopsis]|uniref:Uncharacterized protein n=1 Tax=Microdochium trichocladiopsis TaxID=1682393 RepID=A0A9P9BX43_9PEZI|nr:uncharacterized protein B0I36DRAFT_96042 [Microdochium trichocladiopsis]KAH7035716.1 hypothetical protein B0I36DRAFT_96042 [Microdochium trichocladiopsis]